MLDLKFIRENIDLVWQAIANRHDTAPLDEILELETRRKIFNLILKNPGLHLHALKKQTDISLSTLRYHLEYLNKRSFLTIQNDGRYKRFYPKEGVGKNDKVILQSIKTHRLTYGHE